VKEHIGHREREGEEYEKSGLNGGNAVLTGCNRKEKKTEQKKDQRPKGESQAKGVLLFDLGDPLKFPKGVRI